MNNNSSRPQQRWVSFLKVKLTIFQVSFSHKFERVIIHITHKLDIGFHTPDGKKKEKEKMLWNCYTLQRKGHYQ
jgi:hypothetical protein